MTIASEIQRIQTNIANAYDALEAKGATMPATENTDNLVTTIDTISGGGGDVVNATNNTGNQILAGDKVWVNENNGSYNIENFNGGITNYTVVGNPTFYKGFAAGFSVNDYLTISNSLGAIGNTFYYHFNMGSRPSSILTFRLYTLESFDALLADTNGNLRVYSWSAQQFTTLMTASYNTEYWLRVRTSVGQRSYAISTDGITYGTETVITDTTYGPQPSGTFYLGGYASTSEYWNGFLYLNDCYITDSNGVEIWRAYEPNLTENTLTGYAQENIASGSTGDVLTLLPSEPASKKKRLVSVADNLDTNKLVLYTDDGINWNTSTMPNSRNWGRPFYGDGKFIVPCYGSNIFAYSTDGITWTEGTFPQDTNNDYRYQQGAYGNGIYLIGFRSLNGGPNRLYKSTDGINWTIVKPFEGLGVMSLTNLIFDGTKFIAAFNNSTSIRYSLDGETWTAGGTVPNYASDYVHSTFIYDSIHQLYIIAGSNIPSGADHTTEQYIYVSSDLTTWSRLNLGKTYTNIAPTTSCIIDNKIKIFSGSSALSGNYPQSAGYIEISSAGSSATFVGSSVPRLNYDGGANIINDRAVVIGYGSDQYIYSTDGTTWNTGTLPASSGWWGSCVGEVD